jgi:asparagine synthase (glutamine-hydrolysing)
MCGICGIIDLRAESVIESRLLKMMNAMKHRGPDDEGLFTYKNIGLGFVRLSILDLSMAGHQPMFSNDGRYSIIFNGEIYNYLELKSELQTLGYSFRTGTDTEVLLSAYIQWGESCLDHLSGMWAFAIYDKSREKLFIARDRFGIKPLYFIHTDDFFAFASEIPPLLSLLSGKPEPDYQVIFDYLVFNRTDQTENTFFLEIKKLQHSHFLTIRLDNLKPFEIRNQKWYNLRDCIRDSKGFSHPSEFLDLFTSSIKLHLRSDVPVGVCLSGGLDSSSIVSLLLKRFNLSEIQTFSAVYSKGQRGDESEYISEFGPLLKNMYYITPSADSLLHDLTTFTRAHAEPIPSTSPYAQFKVMELAKGKVVVTLDGQGADEELAGYHYFFGFYFKELLRKWKFRHFLREAYLYVRNHKSSYGLKSLIFFFLPKKFKTLSRIKDKSYLDKHFVRQYWKNDKVSGNLYSSRTLNDALIDHFEFKLEHLLKWEDRNSMWFSIEARVPFLDHRLVEKILATDSNMIIHDGTTKFILREAFTGILPEKIRLRSDKIGFGTPQDEWFRTQEWETLISAILCSASFRQRGIIDPDKALAQFKKHRKGEMNCSNEIWKWIHLELWFREFIDN